MRLYQVPAELDRLMQNYDDLLVDSQGEFTEAVAVAEAELKAYLADSIDKIEAAAVVIAELTADAETLKAEADRLTKRRNAVEANVERLKGIVSAVLDQSFDGKLKTSKFTFWNQNGKPSTKIELAADADGFKCYESNPSLFKRPTLDNAAVKEYEQKMGGVPDWVVIEELPGKRSLRIR